MHHIPAESKLGRCTTKTCVFGIPISAAAVSRSRKQHIMFEASARLYPEQVVKNLHNHTSH